MEEGKDPQVRIPNASFPLPRKKTDAEKPRLFQGVDKVKERKDLTEFFASEGEK